MWRVFKKIFFKTDGNVWKSESYLNEGPFLDFSRGNSNLSMFIFNLVVNHKCVSLFQTVIFVLGVFILFLYQNPHYFCHLSKLWTTITSLFINLLIHHKKKVVYIIIIKITNNDKKRILQQSCF